ncbi:merozoite surface protein 3 [Plasmodium gallinaceum]|uniref:Merozoite surface protein 3 n=1 Tax=Plasmodium gallinaceum TaxID=5849 RepID=A0A1J1H0U5_PLAGA|nr:LOW QUALITY PROTEIN: merozoite surface protein 3 [Plasmodium gallinaceum]CRG97154.1 merozoite surface protein 3 [Plasmodium gallinaceum]
MIKIINIAFYLIFLNSYICENNISLINKAESTQFVDLQKPNLRHGALSNSYTIREKYNNLGSTDEKLQNIQGFYNTNDIQTIQGQDDSIQADKDPNAPKPAINENSVEETSQTQLDEGVSSGTGDNTIDQEEKTKREGKLDGSEESRSDEGNSPQNLEHTKEADQHTTIPSNEVLTPSVTNSEVSEEQNHLQTIPGQDDPIQADKDPNAPKPANRENSVEETSQTKLDEGVSSGTRDNTIDQEEKTKREGKLDGSEERRSDEGNPPQDLEHTKEADQHTTIPSNEVLTPSVTNSEASEEQNHLQTIPGQKEQGPLPSSSLEKTKIGGVAVDNDDGTGPQKERQHVEQQENDADDDEDEEDESDDDDESEDEQDTVTEAGDGVDGEPKKKSKIKKGKKRGVSPSSKEPQEKQDSVGQTQPIQSDVVVAPERVQEDTNSQGHVESTGGVESSTHRTEAGDTKGEDGKLPLTDASQVTELTPERQPKPDELSKETKVTEGESARGSTNGDSTELQTDQNGLNNVKEISKVQTGEQEKQTSIIQEIVVPEGSYDEGDEDVEEEEEEEKKSGNHQNDPKQTQIINQSGIQTGEQEKKTLIIQEIDVPEGSYDEGDEEVEEEEEEEKKSGNHQNDPKQTQIINQPGIQTGEQEKKKSYSGNNDHVSDHGSEEEEEEEEEEHEVDEEEEEEEEEEDEDEDEDDEEQINEEEELDDNIDYEEIEEGEDEDDDDDNGGEDEYSPSDERETRDSRVEDGDSVEDKRPPNDISPEQDIPDTIIDEQRKQEESSRRTEEGQSHENSEQKQKEIITPSNDSSAHKSLIKDFKDDNKVKKEAENKVKNMINLIGDSGVADTLKDLAKDMAQIFLNL